MDNNTFDILRNLPLIVFGLGFVINLVIFLLAGFKLLRANGDMLKVEQGRKTLSNAFIMLFLILVVMISFYFISFLLRQGKVFQPKPSSEGEFPPTSYLESFPESPEFIDLKGYNFNGPWEFNADDRVEDIGITAILCQRGEEYDTIYIGDATGDKLMRHDQFICWRESCNTKLYIAVMRTALDTYDASERNQIELKLNEEFNPPCPKVNN